MLSKSKQINLLKYALLIPIVIGMLIYTSCSKKNERMYEKELTLEQQVEQLKLTLNSKESLSDEEGEALISMFSTIDKGSLFQNYRYRKMKFEGNYPDEDGNVPFAIIEKVPVFPGCEAETNEEQKKCFSKNITDHVNKNFNIKVTKDLGLEGSQRINVIFKIDTDGNIVGVRSRALHPDLEVEAIRVIKTLPKMVPGEQNGKKVNVPYSLPIVFVVD